MTAIELKSDKEKSKHELFKIVTDACKLLLKEHPCADNARQYISSRLSQACIDKFEFGYFPNKNNISNLMSLLNGDELEVLRLKINNKNIFNENESYFTFENNNLVFPYKDVYGNIIGMAGRTLVSENERELLNICKYKNTSFKKSKHLYGMNEAKKSIIEKNYIYVVEGQFDCIKAFDKGIENVVALGSSSMSFDQMSLILRYTDNIMMLLDNDNAGQLGMDKVIKDFGKIAKIKKLKIPDGYKDVDEFLNENDNLDDLI